MVQSKVEYITEFGAASDNDEGILVSFSYTYIRVKRQENFILTDVHFSYLSHVDAFHLIIHMVTYDHFPSYYIIRGSTTQHNYHKFLLIECIGIII